MADDEVVVASAEDPLTTPLLKLAASPRDPSVEVRLYRWGADPAKVFWSALRGPRHDRLDVRGIQVEHGLCALFDFKPEVSRRGLRIRPDPVAGHSAVPFREGAAIALDGEPKVSWTKPASMIAAGDGSDSFQRCAGVATVFECSQRCLLTVDPRQRGHHLCPS